MKDETEDERERGALGEFQIVIGLMIIFGGTPVFSAILHASSGIEYAGAYIACACMYAVGAGLIAYAFYRNSIQGGRKQ